MATLAVAATASADSIPWAPDLETAQAQASRQGRLVLVHFYGDNCPPCARLERNVFSRQDVSQAIASKYIPVKVNATRRRDIAQRYGVNRWPTDVVITPSGQKITSMISPQDPSKYIDTFDQIAARALPPAPATQTGGLVARTTTEPSSNAYASRDDQLALAGHQTPQQEAYATRYQPGTNAPMSHRPPPSAFDQRVASNNTYQPQSAYQPQAGSAYQPNQANSPYSPAPSPAQTGSRYSPEGQSAKYGNQHGNAHGVVAPTNPAAGSRYGASPAAQPNLANSPAPQGAAYQPRYANQPQPQPSAPPFAVSEPQNPAQDTVNPYAQRGVAQAPASQPRQVWEWDQNRPAQSQPRVASNAPPVGVAPQQQPPQQPRQPQPPTNPQPQANQAPLALDGFCPVALSETSTWVKGDPAFGAVHRGRTYLFHSKAAQDQFLQNGDRYAPALSGYDPVKFAEERKIVPGSREFGWFYEGRYYLFADEAGLLRFEKSPRQYHEIVQQAMNPTSNGTQYR